MNPRVCENCGASEEGTPPCKRCLTVLYGHIELESRIRPEGNRLIGEGRARHYDRDGLLVKDTGWEPTGCDLYWPEPEPRKWWEFWK